MKLRDSICEAMMRIIDKTIEHTICRQECDICVTHYNKKATVSHAFG